MAVAGGDTITVLRDREQVKLRLLDIDAPESGQAYGRVAKPSLSDLCFNKVAKLDDSGKDRYGRTLARVYCEGVDATRNKSGVAWLGV